MVTLASRAQCLYKLGRKEEALEKTRKKFTNLLDGDILPRTSVGKIISYYESLIAGNKPVVSDKDNITRAFEEAETYEQMKDFIDEYYDDMNKGRL